MGDEDRKRRRFPALRGERRTRTRKAFSRLHCFQDSSLTNSGCSPMFPDCSGAECLRIELNPELSPWSCLADRSSHQCHALQRHGRQDSNLQLLVLETGGLPIGLRPYDEWYLLPTPAGESNPVRDFCRVAPGRPGRGRCAMFSTDRLPTNCRQG
jgi:hypothetical protein